VSSSSTDVLAEHDDEHCACGWERILEIDFEGIPAAVLAAFPPSFTVLYRCPRCGLQWSVHFDKEPEN